MADGLFLDLVDLLVKSVLPHRLKSARHPGRPPPLLPIPRQEKVEKVQQVDATVAIRVESGRARGGGDSFEIVINSLAAELSVVRHNR